MMNGGSTQGCVKGARQTFLLRQGQPIHSDPHPERVKKGGSSLGSYSAGGEVVCGVGVLFSGNGQHCRTFWPSFVTLTLSFS